MRPWQEEEGLLDVTFERTGERRYAVRVSRPPFAPLAMDPAPGYDPLLPHDLVHFVVEEELGLRLGVFGQLALGGDAGTFRLAAPAADMRERSRSRRRSRRRGERWARQGRRDAERSEWAAAICHHEWLARSSRVGHRRRAAAVADRARRRPPVELAPLSEALVQRVCERLDRLSERWSRLQVGESIVLPWRS